ncbi:hypothetical protein B4064_3396 [Caldibacillus thermoamylovorans]|nr:hypothetical protein B4064_3396 [Caldibacillus thermoamylovorans]
MYSSLGPVKKCQMLLKNNNVQSGKIVYNKKSKDFYFV